MHKQITEFGKILRKIRIDNDLSIESMALIFNISSSYLSLIETGKRKITKDIINIILTNDLFKKEKDKLKEIILNDCLLKKENEFKKLKEFFDVYI